jgi:hypothetical protein
MTMNKQTSPTCKHEFAYYHGIGYSYEQCELCGYRKPPEKPTPEEKCSECGRDKNDHHYACQSSPSPEAKREIVDKTVGKYAHIPVVHEKCKCGLNMPCELGEDAKLASPEAKCEHEWAEISPWHGGEVSVGARYEGCKKCSLAKAKYVAPEARVDWLDAADAHLIQVANGIWQEKWPSGKERLVLAELLKKTYEKGREAR